MTRLLCRRCSTLASGWQGPLRNHKPVELSFQSYGNPAESKGRPLVITHGLFGQKSNWNSIANALQKKLASPIYTVDLRNHGESPWTDGMSYAEMAADLELFLERQVLPTDGRRGATTVSLLGHSMGGKAAAALSLKRPDLIDNLLLVDIVPKSYASHLAPLAGHIQSMLELDLDSSDLKSTSIADKMLSSAIQNNAVRQFLLLNLDRDAAGRYRWKLNLRALRDHMQQIVGFPDDIPHDCSFSKPVLVMFGSESDYVGADDHSILKSYFPKVMYEMVQGAGHWVHADHPTAFMEAVLEFLTPAVVATKVIEAQPAV